MMKNIVVECLERWAKFCVAIFATSNCHEPKEDKTLETLSSQPHSGNRSRLFTSPTYTSTYVSSVHSLAVHSIKYFIFSNVVSTACVSRESMVLDVANCDAHSFVAQSN